MTYQAKKPRKIPDVETLYDLVVRGIPQKEIAKELGMSTPTLSARIADIQAKQGVLLQYRSIQNLQLTELQARVLEAITPEKIEEAPLRDLIFAYKILKERELVDTGKPSDIKGLMHYLIKLEKEEQALDTPPPEDPIEAEFSETEDMAEAMPNL